MIPLAIQLVTFGLLKAAGYLSFNWSFLARAGAIAIGVMFVFTGVAHFFKTDEMVAMFPSAIPGKVGLVYMSGVFEVVAGACLIAGLGPQRIIAMALVGFLVLSLPLNIYSAVNGTGLGAKGASYLWFRIPLQVFWGWWLLHFVKPLG